PQTKELQSIAFSAKIEPFRYETCPKTRLNCSCTRRGMLRSLVSGSILLPGIVSSILASESREDGLNPLAPKAPHFPAKARRVIFLYMSGGVSHVDSFDPKPKLVSDHGKKTKQDRKSTRLNS